MQHFHKEGSITSVKGIKAAGIFAGIKYLTFTLPVESFMIKGVKILFNISVGWFIVSFLDQVIVQYWIPYTQKTESDLDDHLVPFIRKFIKVFVIVILIIMIISQLGYNVTSLITGLGIGGLAIALAAQSMLGNIFGGLNIIWDKPFKIGDRIRMDRFDGTVTEIGMRSTKIRTLEGTYVSIPNQMVSAQPLENLTRDQIYVTPKSEGSVNAKSDGKKSHKGENKDEIQTAIPESQIPRRVLLNIGLTYNTSTQKIRQAQEIIKEVVKTTKGTDGNCRTSFKTFGDFSLMIEVVWFCKDILNLPEVTNEVNLGIKDGLEKEGIQMAFPTRTLYMKNS